MKEATGANAQTQAIKANLEVLVGTESGCHNASALGPLRPEQYPLL